MDVVSSTQNSKFPKRSPSNVFNDKDKDESNPLSVGQKPPGIERDLVDLSKKAKETIEHLEEEVHSLIEKHPMYASMFFSKDQTSKVNELESLSSLLKEPSYQQMIENDPKFVEFYEKVIELGQIYQANLHRYQNDLRSTKPLTYSKPYGLE